MILACACLQAACLTGMQALNMALWSPKKSGHTAQGCRRFELPSVGALLRLVSTVQCCDRTSRMAQSSVVIGHQGWNIKVGHQGWNIKDDTEPNPEASLSKLCFQAEHREKPSM